MVVAGAFLAFAGWAYFTPKPAPVPGRTETWMEKVAPATVAEYSFIPNPNPSEGLCSYKSPKMVYDALAPTVGILARVYESQGQKYDVQLIASRDKGSFHDPRVCFTAQHYNIAEEQQISIPTQTRGNIPATLAKMDGPDGPTVAVYFYHGPHGFYGDTTKLKIAMLMEQIRGKNDVDAAFYRFIPLGDLNTDRLLRFIGLYMDKAGKDSNGYF